MAFFPNFLRMRYKLEQQAKTRKPFLEDQMPKCSDLINYYSNSDLPHLFLSTCDPDPLDEIAIEASYKIATSPEVRKILSWTTRRTLSAVLTGNWFSKDVYIRITASMLNKLVESNIISKNLSIYYHDNLVANVAALYYEVSTEELPFLPHGVRILMRYQSVEQCSAYFGGTLIHNVSDRLIKEF